MPPYQNNKLSEIKVALVEQCAVYLSKKYGNIANYPAPEGWQELFIIKCQWIQQCFRKIHNPEYISTAQAAHWINTNQCYFLFHEIYDNLLHFVVANENSINVLQSFINRWLSAGRSLDTLDPHKQSALSIANSCNNINAFKVLVNQGVDPLEPNYDGSTQLNHIIDRIESGQTDSSALDEWIQSGLPTDIYGKYIAIDDQHKVGLTILLQKVLEQKISTIIMLAKYGIGTQNPDNGNYLLDYIINFVNNKSTMLQALIREKIDLSKADLEQILVSSLHPYIEIDFSSL